MTIIKKEQSNKFHYKEKINLYYYSKNSNYIKIIIIAMTHLTGRRMIPTLDHRKVFWWGERNSLTVIDLETLKLTEYPMSVPSSRSKLITYDIMVIKQKIVYIMYENDDYKMIYYYDMLQEKLEGIWKYSNDEFEEFGVMCRSISANEKLRAVAIGGCASRVGKMTVKPFVSVHRVESKGRFPVLCTKSFGFLDDCISSIEFMYFAKKPTILACDSGSLVVLEFRDGCEIEVLRCVKLHESKDSFFFLS